MAPPPSPSRSSAPSLPRLQPIQTVSGPPAPLSGRSPPVVLFAEECTDQEGVTHAVNDESSSEYVGTPRTPTRRRSPSPRASTGLDGLSALSSLSEVARPLLRLLSKVSFGAGDGNVIPLTPRPSERRLHRSRKDEERGTGESGSDSGSCSDSEASWDDGLASRRRRGSLSFPIALFVLILNAAAMGCMVYSVVQRPVRRVADSPQSAQRTEQASDSELLVVERGSLEQLTKEGVDVGRLADVALKDGKVIVHINVTEAARLSSKHD